MAKHPHFMGDIFALTKPRITLMTVLVALAGLLHASSPLFIGPAALSLVAIAALVSGSSAFNMYAERAQDKKMLRTKERPLASGRLHPTWGIVVGFICSVVACGLLYVASNLLTLALSIISLVIYLFCYTPLKQKTWLSLVVGSIPGAMPVVLGYLSLANDIDGKAIALFLWAFLWQIPHFIAISLFREDEYINAGFPVISASFGQVFSKWTLLFSSWLLVFSTLGLFISSVISLISLCFCLILGVIFLTVCHRGVFSSETSSWAKRAFKASLVYQTCLFAILIIDALI
jgi:protoheme IX farnesyltransferase